MRNFGKIFRVTHCRSQEKEEAFVKELTPEKLRGYAVKYIDPAKMYYVVVGDAATQLNELEKVGLGKPVLIEN